MYLAVIDVKSIENYKLILTFENSEKRVFDVSKYLEIGKFRELKDKKIFNSVKVSFDSIEWSNFLDLDPELLYRESIDFNIVKNQLQQGKKDETDQIF